MVDAISAMVANVIFTLGSVAFTLALLPTLLNKRSAVPAFSSALTAGFLYAYVAADLLLGLGAAAVAGASTAVMWTLIFVFRRPSQQNTEAKS